MAFQQKTSSTISKILFLILNDIEPPSSPDKVDGGNDPTVKQVLFTNLSARAGYDTRSIFKRSLTGLNSEFSFS